MVYFISVNYGEFFRYCLDHKINYEDRTKICYVDRIEKIIGKNIYKTDKIIYGYMLNPYIYKRIKEEIAARTRA